MYIGIDIGGTTIRIASSTSLDTIDTLAPQTFPVIADYHEALKTITDTIKLMTDTVHGIGIGLPGILNETKTEYTELQNLRSWEHQPLQKDLQDIFGCPVLLENDATLAAIGEALYGHGLQKEFLFAIWGSGIGGTYIHQIDGRPHPFASEFGNQIIEWDGLQCSCGQKGCLEVYAGGLAIEKKYGKPAAQLSDEEWMEVEQKFAQGLLNALLTHYVPTVIFAGSVALNQPQRLENIGNIIQQHMKLLPPPTLLTSKHGDLIGLYGALGALQKTS